MIVSLSNLELFWESLQDLFATARKDELILIKIEED